MGSAQQFDLSKFQKNPDGTYSKPKTSLQPREVKEPTIDGNPIEWKFKSSQPKNNKSVLTIPGLVPGLNGNDGLMRSHWTNIKKIKQHYKDIISSHLLLGSVHLHPGKVKIDYIGYKSILMDWDNFCASFKHIGDALVDSKIIFDDKPSIVIQFTPQQIKSKRKDQKVLVIIEDAE